MAELAGVFATSHAPLIARDWDKLPPPVRDRFAADFRELGRRLGAARPDVIVEIAPDHWTNFFIDNLPAVCIGLGAAHGPPPEPFLGDFPWKPIPGHAAFARHLLATALAEGFEPALSHHMALDHGFCLPLARMELTALPAIVPLVINSLEPPMPSVARCAQWGRLLAAAIRAYPGPLRVAVLASGGLSHSIGEPTMGDIDEGFDRDCLRLFAAGDEAPLLAYLDERRMASAGNGAHETRNWLVAHAAAEGRGFDLIDYCAVPEVYVGCAFASWEG